MIIYYYNHINMTTEDEQYYSQDEEYIKEFNIQDKIIDTLDKDRFIAKLSARDIIFYTKPWCYNRELNDDRVNELYDNYKSASLIKPTWIFHMINDNSKDTQGLYLIDGQHREKALKKYLLENDDDMKNDDKFICFVYNIDNCESKNKKYSIELFKKINNNRQFKEEELPDDFVAELVDAIAEDPVLSKGIIKNPKTEASHEPNIHKKELNTLFNQHKDRIKNMTYEEIIINLKKINNILSLKEEKFFGNKGSRRDKVLNLAKAKMFYLNLKSTKINTVYWIKFIDNPTDL